MSNRPIQNIHFFLLGGVLVTCLAFPNPGVAQVAETFADGDFRSNPAWTGDVLEFVTVPHGADFALQTNGLAVSDTLQLRTQNSINTGSWRFRFGYRNGTLTNFNQVRFFLTSDSEDLESILDGYHLQIGTNNRNVRLYRSDPDVSDGRLLLGESADQIFPNTEDTLNVVVARDMDNTWFVTVDDELLFAATESATPATGASFSGVWIKHSATRTSDYFFDDIEITSELPPDVFPPRVVDQSFEKDVPGFILDFSEPLSASSLQATGAFSISTLGQPDAVSAINIPDRPDGSGVQLGLGTYPPAGDYEITVSSLTDLAGNAVADTTVSVTVHADTIAPRITGLDVLSAENLRITFSENVTRESTCVVGAYSIEPGVGTPASVTCVQPVVEASIVLEYPLAPGAYELFVSAVEDLSGNALADTSILFTIDFDGGTPIQGDIVVNEIFFDPPDTELEFIELFNRSSKSFDLSEFEFADNRAVFEPVSNVPLAFGPLEYAVLVRGGSDFATTFPGVRFIEPNVWPALNNSSDDVILKFGTTTVDSVSYDPSWGGKDVSLERIDPDGPGNRYSNWGSSIHPSGATPGSENSIFSPDNAGPEITFADQISTTRLRLYFSEPVDPAGLVPSNFSAGGLSPVAVYAVNRSAGATLDFDSEIDSDVLSANALVDLTGNPGLDLNIDIAGLPLVGDLAINEIMFDPRSNDDDGLANQPEYIELYNQTLKLLSLTSLFWTDSPDENEEADTIRVSGQPLAVLPENYAVIFAQKASLSPDEVYSNSSLVDAFPIPFQSSGVRLIHIGATSLGLVNDGGLIRLQRDDLAVVDEVDYDPDWHNPNLRDSKGVSLERVDPRAPSNGRFIWTSSVAPAGGTPGEQNSVFLSPDVKIADAGIEAAPSPFSPDRDGQDDLVAIQYSLEAAPSLVRVRIFDAMGRLVRTLEDAVLSSLTASLFWNGYDDNGNDLPVGIYVILLESISSDSGVSEKHKTAVVLARQLD
ncbi:MAG: hypothetical protein HKN43_06230 [Rhodothermales bacterium]|nr:hypothetical protein [Rhodothermales bacterium]